MELNVKVEYYEGTDCIKSIINLRREVTATYYRNGNIKELIYKKDDNITMYKKWNENGNPI